MKPTLIFDMDGVIVDSNPFHKQAWQEFCKKYGCQLSESEMKTHVYGKTNEDVLPFVFKRELSQQEIKDYTREKEEIFQKLFRPYLVETPGLTDFLQHAKDWFETLAIGTSAPPMNVDFTLDNLNLRKYFSLIVDDTYITRGKPDPEIYLTVASKLGVNPAQCIVIEDSLAGIEAARNAKMRVIGITTTHSKEELAGKVDLAIDDFTKNESQLPDLLTQKV